MALTYSDECLSGVSRSFHRWARLYKLAHGIALRKILLNSWEGVYFDINQEGMDRMMADIASMGGELFVMDDGWFGDKYPRNDDTSSLGDWTVDARMPQGIEGLLASAGKHGIIRHQPDNMTDEEKALCKKVIAEYKEIRPVVQLGDIYRLLSPYDKSGAASLSTCRASGWRDSGPTNVTRCAN